WKVYCKAGNPIPTSSPNPCTMLLRTTGVDLSMGIPSTTDTSTKTIGSRYVKSHSDISFLQQLQPEWGLSVSIYLFTDVIYFSFTDLSKTSIRSKQQPVQDGSITSITPETIHLSVPLGRSTKPVFNVPKIRHHEEVNIFHILHIFHSTLLLPL